MAIKTFSGIVKWAKVRKPDDKYDNYSLDLYLDDESLKAYKSSGIQLKLRESDEGTYVAFKRPAKNHRGENNGPPTVYLKDEQSGEYHRWDEGLIGNGSELIIKVDTYPTKNGTGSRLERVFVSTLVEFDPDAALPETTALPF